MGRSAPARALVGPADLPLNTARIRIDEVGHGRTRMSIENVFPSAKDMEQILGMGMEEA